MNKLLYHFLYVSTWLLSLLPLSLLYIFSDIVFVFIYYIFGYRKRIVWENLKNSFPNKNDEELRKIARNFYLYFCDNFVETIKLLTMSQKEMRRRFVYENCDLLDDYYEQDKNLILYLGHYGNWEWLTFAKTAQACRHPDFLPYSVYHPLESKVFDKFYLKLRSKSGSVLLPQNKVLRKLIEIKKSKEKAFFCFISDQGTGWPNMYFWMQFLNQETAPIVGPERIAKQTGYPVLYIDVTRVKRGYYTGKFMVISEDARDLPEFELTKKYMRLLEQTIVRNPSYWLWTHKRWKRKRKDMPENLAQKINC